MKDNSPKPIIIAIKAIILPTFGVQLGFVFVFGGVGVSGIRVQALQVLGGRI